MSRCANFPVTYVKGGVEEFSSALHRILEDQDAPFSTISILAQSLVYQAAARDGIRVLLGGQGGDEALMGYRKFLLFRMRELLDGRHFMGAISFLSQTLPSMLSEGPRLAHYATRLAAYSKGKANTGHKIEFESEAPTMNLAVSRNDPLWKRSASDVLHFSLPTLLRYEDRNSMAYSIESRLPYLDYRLIELALALPTSLKLAHGYGKYAMRLALKDRIPESIRMMRRKYGFEPNTRGIIHAGLGKEIRELLHASAEVYEPMLKAPVDIEGAFSDHALLQRSKAFGEAMSLLWIGQRGARKSLQPSSTVKRKGESPLRLSQFATRSRSV